MLESLTCEGKRKQVTKQKCIKGLKSIAREMVKSRRLISKASIANISEISFSGK